jgi:hypothetical protein
MTERQFDDFATGDQMSRRSLVAGATFFGAAMAAIGEVEGSRRRFRELQQRCDRFAGRRSENTPGANPRRQDCTRHASGTVRDYRTRDGRRDG